MMVNRPLVFLLTALPFTTALPSVDSLHLTSNLGVQTVSAGFLVDNDGTEYDLSSLYPFVDLLSHDRFIAFDDETNEWDHRSGEVFSMPIHRGVFDDGTILQVQKDRNGNIIYAEIRHVQGKPNTYFVKTQGCENGELLAFSDEQMRETEMNDGFSFEDEEIIENHVRRRETTVDLNKVELDEANLPDFVFERGDGKSSDCPYFKVVKIGVVYDAEFCVQQGGKDEARSRIMMIVAAASVFFENDMCVKLRLTDIYTPDDGCAGTSTFASFPRDKACGGGNSESFIRYFKDWMNQNRDQIGLDPEATFHAFTGYQHRGTLGCAFIGAVCEYPEYAYGVDYMTSISLSTQSVIFTHELAHNLSARHISSEDTAGFRYIMAPSLNNPNDGFSQASIDKILGFLDKEEVSCDTVHFRAPSSSIQPTASHVPSSEQSISPSDQASLHPSEVLAVNPSEAPSLQPTISPETSSLGPTLAPLPDVSRCSVKQVPQDPICILESEALYSCYEATHLMSVQPEPSCSLEQPFFATVRFVACEEKFRTREISNDEGRMLRKRKRRPSNDEESGEIDGVDDDENSEWAESGSLSDLKPKVAIGSNDYGLESFSTGDCSVGCTIVGDHICFLSRLDSAKSKVYVLTFSVIYEGGTEFLNKEVTIQKQDTPMSGCDLASTFCQD